MHSIGIDYIFCYFILMPKLLDRPTYRKHYQMKLVCDITGQSKEAVNMAMWRLGLGKETEDFGRYLLLMMGHPLPISPEALEDCTIDESKAGTFNLGFNKP